MKVGRLLDQLARRGHRLVRADGWWKIVAADSSQSPSPRFVRRLRSQAGELRREVARRQADAIWEAHKAGRAALDADPNEGRFDRAVAVTSEILERECRRLGVELPPVDPDEILVGVRGREWKDRR